MSAERTFSQQIKEEIGNELVEANESEFLALLSGFARQNGSLTLHNGRVGIDLQTGNAVVARKIYQLLRKFFGQLQINIVVRKMVKLKKQNIYVLRIYDEQKLFLSQIHFLVEGDFPSEVPQSFRTSSTLVRRYIQGLFLATGSMNNLHLPSYHLELAVSDALLAQDIIAVLDTYDLRFKHIIRRKLSVLYMKDSTMIGDFLAFIYANRTRFAFEDVRITRDMMNSMNRLMNCEVANEQKTQRASAQQIQYIAYIESKLGNEFFNDREQLIVQMRIKYPEASLLELGELLQAEHNLQISKSGLNHLFRKIKKQALELQSHDGEH